MLDPDSYCSVAAGDPDPRPLHCRCDAPPAALMSRIQVHIYHIKKTKTKGFRLSGASGRNRTADTGIKSPAR